jgi:hypothetical protein
MSDSLAIGIEEIQTPRLFVHTRGRISNRMRYLGEALLDNLPFPIPRCRIDMSRHRPASRERSR